MPLLKHMRTITGPGLRRRRPRPRPRPYEGGRGVLRLGLSPAARERAARLAVAPWAVVARSVRSQHLVDPRARGATGGVSSLELALAPRRLHPAAWFRSGCVDGSGGWSHLTSAGDRHPPATTPTPAMGTYSKVYCPSMGLFRGFIVRRAWSPLCTDEH